MRSGTKERVDVGDGFKVSKKLVSCLYCKENLLKGHSGMVIKSSDFLFKGCHSSCCINDRAVGITFHLSTFFLYKYMSF